MRTFLVAALLCLAPSLARADGCYVCTSGSQAQCRDYCRYSGADTFDARKRCEKKGCHIAGTSACPAESRFRVCQAPHPAGPVLAAIPWCASRTLARLR